MLSLKHKDNSMIHKLILFNFGLICTVLCGYIITIKPSIYKLNALKKAIVQLHTKQNNIRHQINNNIILQQELTSKTQEIIPRVNLQLIPPLITTIAKECRLNSLSIQPQKTTTDTTLRTDILQLQTRGTYQQLTTFVSALAKLNACLIIEQLHLAPRIDAYTTYNTLILNLTIHISSTTMNIKYLPLHQSTTPHMGKNSYNPFNPVTIQQSYYNLAKWTTAELHFLGILQQHSHTWTVVADPTGHIHLIDQKSTNP